MASQDGWKDALIKGFAVILFFILTGWATWITTNLMSMDKKLSAVDSLQRNWMITGRNKERISEYHGADTSPPKFFKDN